MQGKINRGRHIDHPDGRHSIRTSNQCPPPPSPYFLQAGCPSCRPTNSIKAPNQRNFGGDSFTLVTNTSSLESTVRLIPSALLQSFCYCLTSPCTCQSSFSIHQSHHPSLTRSFTPHIPSTCFTNPSRLRLSCYLCTVFMD